MPPSATNERFTHELVQCQHRLFGYILTVVAHPELAHEVLQRTNVVLLEKRESYEPGTNFIAWACRIAYFEVLAERRDAGRDRLRFSDAFMSAVADQIAAREPEADARHRALHRCLDELNPNHRDFIDRRYNRSERVDDIAKEVGRTAGAVSAALYAARKALADCIRRNTEVDREHPRDAEASS